MGEGKFHQGNRDWNYLMIRKPTAIPTFEKSLNWLIAKATSNSTTLKKNKISNKPSKRKSPSKKKKYCASILLLIYKNHIKTMVLRGHCKHIQLINFRD